MQSGITKNNQHGLLMSYNPLYLDFENGQIVKVPDDSAITNVFPVGYVVTLTSNTNPGATLGYGVWVLLGSQAVGKYTIYHFERTE